MTGRRKAKGVLKDRDNNRHRSSERKRSVKILINLFV